MQNNLVRKGLVIGIIVLFVGVNIVPVTGLVENNNTTSLLEKQIGSSGDLLFERPIVKLMELAHMSALSAAIIKDNEVIWAKGYGLYDRENTKEADEYTIFLMASISKTFTATAIMQLYERGFFDLDDDVNGYLNFNLRNPKYPDKEITFRMLLSHQSSLAVDLPTFKFNRVIPAGLEVVGYPYPFLRDYLVPGGLHYKPQVWTDATPGEETYYSNIGYATLGYLVEILSGKTFEEYCSENIFEPLDMNNSSFRLANVNSSRVAVPYDFQSGEYYPFLHYDTLDYPASGLRTSVLDLSHFLIVHMNGGVYNGVRILNESTVELMHEAQGSNDRQFGLGFQIWEKLTGTHIGHSGGMDGVATKMVFRLSDALGIIFFVNERVQNYREIFAFRLIERLLFLKANGF